MAAAAPFIRAVEGFMRWIIAVARWPTVATLTKVPDWGVI